MPRIARISLKGVPYHITQRGNGRQQVFFDDQDYSLYLDLLREYSEGAALRILAYCLMPNHVHLIAVPVQDKSMPLALARAHADFARHFNLRHRSCGHVWQSRFFSCPLDDAHLWQAMAYVERNPVRARLVSEAQAWPWSSACARLSQVAHSNFVDRTRWRAEYNAKQWRSVLASSVDEEAFGRRLQEASRRGRPFGEDGFANDLERKAGRALRPRPVGRPRKHALQPDQLSLDIGI